MPPPVVLVVSILLGWPLLQIASVLLVRDRRRRMRALAVELKADPRYGRDDAALIDREIREAKGDAFFAFAPIALPFAILAAALAELVGWAPSPGGARRAERIEEQLNALHVEMKRRTGAETVDGDARFRELRGLATEIGFLRWPTTAVITVLTCLPALPLYLLAYGARQTLSVIPRATVSLGRALQLTGLGLQGHATR